MTSFIVSLFRLVFGLIIFSLVVSFITSNPEPIELSFFPLPNNVTVPIYALGIGSLLFGMLLGGIILTVSRLIGSTSNFGELRKLRNENKALLQEVKGLRLDREISNKQKYSASPLLISEPNPVLKEVS